MYYDANSDNSLPTQTFDLCIIGAGPAGITLSAELADSAIQICLLDAGGEKYSLESQKLYSPQFQPESYEDTTFNRLRMLGGSSNHWENNTSEFMPSDFEYKEWIQNSGWPIEYSDIQPHYQKAALYCQTDSDGYDSKIWHDYFNINDILESTKGMETGIAKASLPPTRFFNSHKEVLFKAQNITIIKNANLVDLEVDLATKAISSATFLNYKKKPFIVKSKVFVLAMGGIENARFMLVVNEKYDNQVGNIHGLVGRYFMDHPLLRVAQLYSENDDLGLLTSRKVVGRKVVGGFMQHTDHSVQKNQIVNIRMPLFKASALQLSGGVESFHVLNEAIKRRQLPESTLKHMLNALKDIDAVKESALRKIFDFKLLTYLDEFEGYEIPAMLEQLPHYNNRIALGSERDSLGVKKHTVFWQFHDEDFDLSWKSLRLAASQLARQNIGRLRVMEEFENRLQDEKLYVSHHHMGTTRMAKNEKEGVVDFNCKVFNTQNLFIAGSSTFVTGSHVPPTLTIVALAIRLANFLKTSKGLFQL